MARAKAKTKAKSNLKEGVIMGKKGFVKVATNVVAAIAAKVALDVDGVVGTSTGNVRGVIEKMTKDATRGVTVEPGSEGNIISINIVVEYGFGVKAVAEKVQEQVTWAVEEHAASPVLAVDIFVQGVFLPSSLPKGTIPSGKE